MLARRSFLGAASAAALASAAAGCAVAPLAAPAPARAGHAPLRKVAFGSCIDQNKPQPIWDAILAGKPDLFVFGGDNVYASAQPWSRSRLQAAYAQLASDPGFARLRRTVPQLAIWDDNDYGLNDGGADFAYKQDSKDVFLEFWGAARDDERRRRAGVYHALRFGPPGQTVQIVLLDCRSFRSPLRATDQSGGAGKERYLPDPDPAKTMLGPTQWQWLEEQLRLPADIRLLVSGVQVIATGHGWESWGNLPLERERLLALIERTGANGVVFLSGDRHIGALYRDTRPGRYPLFEITSSGMTHAWTQAREAGPNRLGDLVTVNHYATLEFDWERARLRFALLSETGLPLRSHSVSLAELS